MTNNLFVRYKRIQKGAVLNDATCPISQNKFICTRFYVPCANKYYSADTVNNHINR